MSANGERRTTFLLEARGVKKYFPVRRGLLRRTVGDVQAVDGVDLQMRAGRDARARRRVRVRQVDARADAAAAARADGGRDLFEGAT